MSLELEPEAQAALDEPAVLALVELVEPRGAVGHSLLRLLQLLEHVEAENLLPEIAVVQGRAEHDLVELLQLLDGELARQKLEADGRVGQLPPHPFERRLQYRRVVEGEPRERGDGEPARLPRVRRGSDGVLVG